VLHIAFRDPKGQLRDILFTDAPGEWFIQWARVPDDATAEGARWVIKHADALIMLIDSASLADPKKLPHSRRSTRDLIERVGAVASHLPVAVVWTKEDVQVPDNVRITLERACTEFVPYAATLRTSVNNPETIAKCFMDVILATDISALKSNTFEPVLSVDPFLAFRGIYVDQ
jgi:hypothetical protein